MTDLNGHDLVQRTESGENLLDTVNLLAEVTASIECGTADVEPRLVRAVLQQVTALLDACGDRSTDTVATTAFNVAASRLRSSITEIYAVVG